MNNLPRTNRRTIAQGALWTLPAVMGTSVVPSYASSKAPTTLSSMTSFKMGSYTNSTCAGKQQFEVSQNSASTYINVTNIQSGTTLSGLYALYYLHVDAGTTFKRVTGSSTCWSVPVATGKTMTYNGVIFREYKSAYSCTYTIAQGTWTQPSANNFDFISSCQSSIKTSRYYTYNQFITLTSAQGTSQVISKYLKLPTPQAVTVA